MIETTTETLKSMDIEQPMVFVYNKIDLTDENEPRTQANELFVSASKKLGLNLLADAIQASIFKEYRVQNLLIPYDEGAVQARINEQTHVIKQEEREEGWFIKAFFNEQDRLAFERFL